MKKAVTAEKAPKAIGPYSQAIAGNGLLFVSGQLPIHPESGQLDADIKLQTAQSLENLKAILEKAGLTLQHVVKTTIFLKSMDDFETVNTIYGEYFTENYPARVCVEVARLPMNALVEMDAIAIVE